MKEPKSAHDLLLYKAAHNKVMYRGCSKDQMREGLKNVQSSIADGRNDDDEVSPSGGSLLSC